jgi:hypothetical protein
VWYRTSVLEDQFRMFLQFLVYQSIFEADSGMKIVWKIKQPLNTLVEWS